MAVQKDGFQKRGRGNRKLVQVAILLLIFLLFENGKGITNDIRKKDFPDGDRSIFELNAGLEKQYQIQINSTQCSDKPQCQTKVSSWPTPPKAKSQDYLKESRVIYEFQKKKYNGCSAKLSLFQEKINLFPKTIFDQKIYFPGTIIRMEDQTDYEKNILPIYFQPIHRKPFLIQISDRNLSTLHNIDSNQKFQQVIEQQFQTRIDGFNGKPINFYIQEGYKIQNLLRGLKLPSQIFNKLGLLADSQFYNYQQKDHTNCKIPLSRTVIVLNQNLLQAKVVRQNKSSLFDELLYDSGKDVIGQKIKERLLGQDDQPYFVMNSQYGRLLILSILDNNSTILLTQKLMTYFKDMKVQNREQFFNTLQVLAENPLNNYFVGGLDPNYYLQTKYRGRIVEKKVINVRKIFSDFTPELIKSLQPFAGFMYNSNGVMRTNIQTRVFPIYNCTIQLKIDVKSIDGGLIMMLSEQIEKISNPKQLFNVTHPGTYAITLFARDAFRLKFLAKGREEKGYSLFILKKQQLYTSQAQFSILINGQKLLDKKFRAQRSTIQYHPFTMVLDPQNYEEIKLLTEEPEDANPDPFLGPY